MAINYVVRHQSIDYGTQRTVGTAGGDEAAPDLDADRSFDLGVVQVDAGDGSVGLGGGEQAVITVAHKAGSSQGRRVLVG